MNESFQTLLNLMHHLQPVTVLTGAGISASSGLPVYRNEHGNWIHSKPVQGPEFRADATIRQRYWCRSFFGWPAFLKARPNSAHTDIASLQAKNCLATVITQNVDGLHKAAGSPGTIALHGDLFEVICLDCGSISSRTDHQQRLQHYNPEIHQMTFTPAPDGDAIIDQAVVKQFNVVGCEQCNGVLKPNVVFYGDNVPKERVQHCFSELSKSKMLICIGTSLMVYSSYRFCRAAQESDVPIVIINNGVTRADDMAHLKINDDCNKVLARLRQALR